MNAHNMSTGENQEITDDQVRTMLKGKIDSENLCSTDTAMTFKYEDQDCLKTQDNPSTNFSHNKTESIHIDRSTNGLSSQEATILEQINIRPSQVEKSIKDEIENSDFIIRDRIGVGGMGEIFAARQTSIDRQIAIKMIKSEDVSEAVKFKFITEALVTGELDHTNIIPVYELGTTQEEKLFYAMKQVIGTSWDSVIREKSEAENLDILLRVCDAIAYAHYKGIVHRDLKPENVMLGDYGEILVMDWGLAISYKEGGKAEILPEKTGFAGTPAYMSPEMARCEGNQIGPWSDIYILGGILYEIVTGLRPHRGKNVVMCLRKAMNNEIQKTNAESEIVEIALKAMSTDIEDRYSSVKDFQHAIREYISHQESIKLAKTAEKDLETAEKTRQYDDFSNSLFRFREAARLWSGNTLAKQGILDCSLAYAELAHEKEDFDLAFSLLKPGISEHDILRAQVEKSRNLRENRQRKVKILTYCSIALVAIIIVILSGAFIWVNNEREKALFEEKKARLAQAKSEKENYFNTITIANRKIVEDLLFDQAKSLLNSTPPSLRAWEWGRLMQLSHMDLLTLKGHTDSVETLAFSPDNKMIVTGSRDKTAIIWDVESGKLIHQLKGHLESIYHVSFSHDGKKVYTYSRDKAMTWDVKTGIEAGAIANKHNSFVRSFKFSNDNTIKATIRDTEVLLTHANSNQLIWRLNKHIKDIYTMAFSPSSDLIATGGQDKIAYVWSTKTGKPILSLRGHSKGIRAIGFSSDSKYIATGGMDNLVKIWNANQLMDRTSLKAHRHIVESATFSPDGKNIVTASRDRTAIIWDVETGDAIHTLKGHKNYIYDVDYSPDGRMIASGSKDKTVKLWDAKTGEILKIFKGHLAGVEAIAFSHDGTKLVSGAWDAKAIVWDVSTGRAIVILAGHTSAVLSVAFSPDSKTIITGSKDRSAIIWDRDTGKMKFHLTQAEQSIYAVTFSPDGKQVATAGWDNVIRLYDVSNGKLLQIFQGHTNGIEAIDFSSDGRRLVSGSRDHTIKIWNVENGRQLLTFQGHDDIIKDVEFSPDGNLIVSASNDETAIIWKTYTAGNMMH